MYGLLVENLASFIRIQWGEGKWDMVRKSAGIDAPSFSIHHVYPETLLNRLAKTAFQVLGVEEKQFFEAMGIYFVEYVGQYGYDEMLTVLGRHMRDFLNGLDNLHEYLKFSYTKMRAPSFYCDNETADGLRLHYRSKRRGFVYYVMGQIKQVARHFYNQDCEIAVISEVLDGETMHTIFQLTFDNNAFTEAESLKSMIRDEQQLPIRASIIFELFPFCIVFSPEMEIKFTGHALLLILKDIVGQYMTEAFELVKPMISFCFATILDRRNNIFELVTVAPIKDDDALTGGSFELESDDETGTSLTLRGQMMHMEEWNMILFLANPVMTSVNGLVEAGLYINDLSLHDCSRDLVLAGKQQSVELKLALDQEQQKSKHLEESMRKLDEEIRKTDELLYQMIPKQVADRLRSGESPVDTCEVFEMVSILFSDVVTFTDICSRITPMQVVTMLNHMYSLFDQLTERNGVYKVETIGDSYMVVSGAPVAEANHAERICDMAMDMVDAMQAIVDPSRVGEPLKIRVGCHSGMVVAGVVGVKMPRYCLFGDAVNTASRMESTSEGSRIQISEGCQSRLPPPYLTELRGKVSVKGKGEMNTYWLMGRENRAPLSKVNTKSFNWNAPQSSKQKSLNAQMSKQSSILSEDIKSDTAGLVKDIKKTTSSEKKIEPKDSFNEPVEMTGEAAEAGAPVVKPIGKTSSAFAARQNFKQSIPSNFSVASDVSLSSSKATPQVKPSLASVVQTVIESVPKNENLSISTPTSATPTESLDSKIASRRPSIFQDLVRSVSPTSTLVPLLQSGNVGETTSVSNTKSVTNQGKMEATTVSTVDSEILSIPSNDNVTRRPSTPRIIESTKFGTIIQWDNAGNVPQTGIVNAGVDVKGPIDSVGSGFTTITSDKNLLSPTDIPEVPAVTEFEKFIENGIPIPTERRKSRLMEGINGIRQESQQWKNKIRDKKLSGLSIDGMSDLGCSEFTAKQKEIISQACNLL